MGAFAQKPSVSLTDHLLFWNPTKSGNGNEIVMMSVQDFVDEIIAPIDGNYLLLTGGTMTGMIKGAAGVQVDQAININLNTVASNYIILRTDSGADPIESFGTVTAGTIVRIRVKEGDPGHNGNGEIVASANIQTLDGLNITTAALDYFEMISLGGGAWRITNYQKAGVNTYLPTAGGTMTGDIIMSDGFSIASAEMGINFDDSGQRLVLGGGNLSVILNKLTDVFSVELNGSTGFSLDGLNETVALGSASTNLGIDSGNDVITLTSIGAGNIELDGTQGKMSFNLGAAILYFQDLPIYADDAAAGVGGLVTAAIYKTAAGALRIKL